MRDDLKVQVYDRMTDPNFEWTKRRLRRRGAFCAMGVVCDLAIEAGVADVAWDPAGDDPAEFEVRYTYDFKGEPMTDWAGGSAPPAILEWAGMTEFEQGQIVEFNDKDSVLSPVEVAEFIKNYVPPEADDA